MIMPITVHKPESFGWDETPKEVFRHDPERLIVARLRRSENELTAFLNEWCGIEFAAQRPGGS